MAKKKREQKSEVVEQGEQLALIDIAPENSKKIIGVARRYRVAQGQRIEALVREVAEKQKLLELIKEAKLTPLEGGKIRFRVNGLIITVTPRDELVRVKEEGEKASESKDE